MGLFFFCGRLTFLSLQFPQFHLPPGLHHVKRQRYDGCNLRRRNKGLYMTSLIVTILHILVYYYHFLYHHTVSLKVSSAIKTAFPLALLYCILTLTFQSLVWFSNTQIIPSGTSNYATFNSTLSDIQYLNHMTFMSPDRLKPVPNSNPIKITQH